MDISGKYIKFTLSTCPPCVYPWVCWGSSKESQSFPCCYNKLQFTQVTTEDKTKIITITTALCRSKMKAVGSGQRAVSSSCFEMPNQNCCLWLLALVVTWCKSSERIPVASYKDLCQFEAHSVLLNGTIIKSQIGR